MRHLPDPAGHECACRGSGSVPPASSASPRGTERWTTHAGIDLAGLAARVREGDDRAFRELFDHLAPLYHRHALRITGSPDVADDIVQQAFVKAHRQLHEMVGKFDGWVFRIVHNLCQDHLRNIRTTSHDSYEQDALESPFRSPAEEIELEEMRRGLSRAIEGLPESYRIPFLLHHEDGLKYEDIASQLRTTAGAVKMRVHRARLLMQPMLARFTA